MSFTQEVMKYKKEADGKYAKRRQETKKRHKTRLRYAIIEGLKFGLVLSLVCTICYMHQDPFFSWPPKFSLNEVLAMPGSIVVSVVSVLAITITIVEKWFLWAKIEDGTAMGK